MQQPTNKVTSGTETMRKWEAQREEARKQAYRKTQEAPYRCPDCSGKLTYQEGCLLCYQCGYSKC